MDGRLAEREAIEESGVFSAELSGVGYSEESEVKECSDMAGRHSLEQDEDVGVVVNDPPPAGAGTRQTGIADSGTWCGGTAGAPRRSGD